MTHLKHIAILVFSGLLLIACGQEQPNQTDDAHLQVMVSILPQAEFVERIGGERVKVGVLVPPGQGPATYEPTPKQMTELADAQIFFSIGVDFERALLSSIERTLPELKIVDTREGITLRTMTAHHHNEGDPGSVGHDETGDQHSHQHDEHSHEQAGADPHIWLAPELVQQQARNIAAALIGEDPGHRTFYEANLDSYLADLQALDNQLRESLAPVRGKTLLVYHPAWGYFADAYGLRQEAIEMLGREPTGRQLARIIEHARTEDVRVIFVQAQFSRSSAEAVAEAIGGSVVVMDPLARDHLANLERVAREIGAALNP